MSDEFHCYIVLSEYQDGSGEQYASVDSPVFLTAWEAMKWISKYLTHGFADFLGEPGISRQAVWDLQTGILRRFNQEQAVKFVSTEFPELSHFRGWIVSLTIIPTILSESIVNNMQS